MMRRFQDGKPGTLRRKARSSAFEQKAKIGQCNPHWRVMRQVGAEIMAL
jgi:hypothetical protein